MGKSFNFSEVTRRKQWMVNQNLADSFLTGLNFISTGITFYAETRSLHFFLFESFSSSKETRWIFYPKTETKIDLENMFRFFIKL